MQPPCFECDFSPSCLSPRLDRSAEFLVRFLVTLGSSGKQRTGGAAAAGKQRKQQGAGIAAALFPPATDRRGQGRGWLSLLQPAPLKELLAHLRGYCRELLSRLMRYCRALAAGIAAMPGELAAMTSTNAAGPLPPGGTRHANTNGGYPLATSGQQQAVVRAAAKNGLPPVPPPPPPLPEAVMIELDGVRFAAAVRMAARAREKGLPYPPLTELAEGSQGEQNEDVPLNPRHGPYP